MGDKGNNIGRDVITWGCVLATILSWDRNGGIILALLHGWLSWAYVVWFAVTRQGG